MSRLFVVERQIQVDAAHRIPTHGSKCRNLHGHRYTITAVCEGELITTGEQQGMVIDFGFLREAMMDEIHKKCDHSLILGIEDPLVAALIPDADRLQNVLIPQVRAQKGIRTIEPVVGAMYLMDKIPTAEILAEHWYDLLAPHVSKITAGQARLAQIKVSETPYSLAVFPVTAPQQAA